MNKDRVLRDIIRKGDADKLPYGFDSKVMTRVFRKAEQQKRRSYYIGIGTISLVSLAMIAATIYVIVSFLDVSITFPKIDIPNPDINMVSFFVFIAAIALFLLFLDTLVRKKKSISRTIHE